MKKIFLLFATLLPLAAFAQLPQGFTLKCTVGTLNSPAKAFLVYKLGANNVIDSVAIVNGNFSITDSVYNPVNAVLAIDRKGVGFSNLDAKTDVLDLFLEKRIITITSPDSVAKAKITGSPINDDNKKLEAQLKPVTDKVKLLMAESKAATPEQQKSPDFQNNLQARYKVIQAEQKEVLKAYILANHDSYLSLMALAAVGGPTPEPGEIDPLYNSLSPRLKDMETAKQIKQAIDGLRVTELGALAPDFIENDANDQPIKLSSFRGKYVLLDFWASWCGPCRQENPNVVSAYNRYKTKNFTIVGISLDKAEGKSDWLAAVKNDGLVWTQLSDLKFWNNEAALLYSVKSIPQNFLIDPTGKIIAKNLRGEDLDNKLAELFGKM